MNSALSFVFRMQILAVTLLGWLIMYFFVNRLKVAHERRLNFGTAFDEYIPFIPQFALIYFSTYVFVVQPFFVLSNARYFYLMLTSFIAISVISSLIHAVTPSKIERMEVIAVGGVSSRMLGLFQKVCKPYGNFPSMHVALSVPVVIANFMVAGPMQGSLMFAWAVLIALSTLFTKQHYIIDVLVGMTVGIMIFSLVLWLMLV